MTFSSRLKVHERVKNDAMTRGRAIYPMAGTSDGAIDDHVIIASP